MRKQELFQKKYLAATDIPEAPPTVVISSVTHEPMQDGKLKPVVFFQGWQKGVVCNVTNANVLYSLAGTDDDVDWPGLKLELHTEMVTFQGKTALAIRFRPPWQRRAADATPTPQPKLNGDEPPPHTSIPDDLNDAVPY